MNHMPINLVIAINRLYVKYAYVMLYSFLCHHPEPVSVYILHHELTPEDEAILQTLGQQFAVHISLVYVPDSLLPPPEVLETSSWGIEAYFRLAITDLLPASVDRALYLDTDIIVNAPVYDLYELDFGSKLIAACKEFTCHPPFGNYRDVLFAPLFEHGFSYFNSGMILYNLAALRPDYSFRTYMDTARELHYAIEYPDQDLLNYCHYQDTLFVDPFLYNLNARYGYDDYNIHYDELKQRGVIIHYASSKPWRGNFLHYDIEWLWWEYAKHTPFYRQLLEEALRENIMDSPLNLYIADLAQKNAALYQKLETYEQLLETHGGTLS